MAAKAKVLLAEDDASLGFIIKDALEEDGYEVLLCPDGQTAIERFNKNEFDICLLDVMMPNKDGFAVAKKVRQQTDLIPILFLTAKSMEEDKIKGFQSGKVQQYAIYFLAGVIGLAVLFIYIWK